MNHPERSVPIYEILNRRADRLPVRLHTQNGTLTNLRDFDHGGIGYARLLKADYLQGKSKDKTTKPVVLKAGKDIGTIESKGIAKLKPHLSVLEPFESGPDFLVYPDLSASGGEDLMRVLTSQGPLSFHYFRDFARMHKKMWERTSMHVEDVVDPDFDGYSRKADSAVQGLRGKYISSSSFNYPFSHLIDYPYEFIINGTPVGKLSEGLGVMKARILKGEEKGLALCHGDESFGNCLVLPQRDDTNKIESGLYMIDSTAVGYRSPHESVAKILSRVEIETSKMLSFSINNHGDSVHLNTQTTMRGDLYRVSLILGDEFEEYLDTSEKRSNTAAFMLMYFLREAERAAKRGREQVVPYLLARGLSLIPAIRDGELSTFPLSREKKFQSSIVYPTATASIHEKPAIVKEESGFHLHSIDRLEDIAPVLEVMSPKLKSQQTASIDLDGTIIGPEIPSVLDGLKLLKDYYLTSIATGSGIHTIRRKLTAKFGNLPKDISGLFSGPIIAENGARIFNPRTDTLLPSEEDLLYERSVNREEGVFEAVNLVSKLRELSDFKYCGFLPSLSGVKQSGYSIDPFSYCMFVPEGEDRDSVIHQLRDTYGGNHRVFPWDEFEMLLEGLSFTKMMIKPHERRGDTYKIVMDASANSEHLGTIDGDGTLDILARGVTKQSALSRFSQMIMESYTRDSAGIIHFGNSFNDLPVFSDPQNTAFLVNSDPKVTSEILKKIKRLRKGTVAVVAPNLLNDVFFQLSARKEFQLKGAKHKLPGQDVLFHA